MTSLHLDYETASEVDLPKAGTHVYAAHPSTRILMLGWAIDDEPVSLWEPHKCAIPPARLVQALTDPSVLVYAANAQFERLITHYCLGVSIPYERWRCVLVAAYYLGFAGGLDQILGQCGLPQKDQRGKAHINRFCKPAASNHKADWYTWETRPVEWQEFCEYCKQDVEVERALMHYLSCYPKMHDWDWHQWFIDQRINDRGVPLDVEFASRAIELWGTEKQRLTDRLSAHTGLAKVTRGPFLEYVNARTPGAPFHSLAADYVTSRVSAGDLPSDVLDALKLWSAKEAKATTKYAAVLKCVSSDGRARGMFQYKGASRTDRAGGRRLQLQNLKRPVVDSIDEIPDFVDCIKRHDGATLQARWGVNISDALGGGIRHVIKAPPGRTLVIADLSSIESVLLGWLTYCEAINQTFRSGRDSYKVFASQYYGIPYESVNKAQRGFSKPPVLGCGYMLGWAGLIRYAEGMGVDMSEREAVRAVETFRGMYPEIRKFWYWLSDAIACTTKTGTPTSGYRLLIERDADFLRIKLPSGRNLSYYKPEMHMLPAPWDHKKYIENFTYMGMNDKRKWLRIAAHPGGVTENIIQSIAGDILWLGIVRAFHRGLDVILHVHDEIVAESWVQDAQQHLDTLIDCMTEPPAWAPDMWLGSQGIITPAYTKD